MQADAFSSRWIDLDDDRPDLSNDPTTPVMVKRNDTGQLFSVRSIVVETHEDGGATVWIGVDEY